MNTKNSIIEKKILVIEDDPEWMAKITTYLEKEGFLVFQAQNYSLAKATVESADKRYVDLAVILLDLNLPDGNGIDLLDFIFPLWRREKTRVVIVTSAGWVTDDEKARSYPFYSGYVSKNLPDFINDLIEAVNQAIRDRE